MDTDQRKCRHAERRLARTTATSRGLSRAVGAEHGESPPMTDALRWFTVESFAATATNDHAKQMGEPSHEAFPDRARDPRRQRADRNPAARDLREVERRRSVARRAVPMD